MKSNQNIITALIIASLGFSACTSPTVTSTAQPNSPAPNVTSSANPTIITNSLSLYPNLIVGDQPINNQLVIASLNLDKPGYIVIQNDINGNPGDVIGTSDLLPAGTHNDVTVTIDKSKAGNNVHVSLYYEVNNDSKFNISIDQPVTINNRIITLPMNFSTNINQSIVSFLPNLVVNNQNLNNNQLSIKSVSIDKPGYVVIQKDLSGEPGPVIGHSNLLTPGGYNNVMINIDSSQANPLVHVTVNYEDNNNSTFDYPMADQPAVIANQTVSMNIENTN